MRHIERFKEIRTFGATAEVRSRGPKISLTPVGERTTAEVAAAQRRAGRRRPSRLRRRRCTNERNRQEHSEGSAKKLGNFLQDRQDRQVIWRTD
jgi:hypothetical protein